MSFQGERRSGVIHEWQQDTPSFVTLETSHCHPLCPLALSKQLQLFGGTQESSFFQRSFGFMPSHPNIPISGDDEQVSCQEVR